MVNHHIADVVVAVLEALRTAMQKMPVFVNVPDHVLRSIELQRAVAVAFDFPVDFFVEAGFPFLLRIRRGDGVDFGKNPSGGESEGILFGIGIRSDCFFRVRTVDPCLNGVYEFVRFSERQRAAHRDSERVHCLHDLEFGFYLFV